MTNGHLPVYLKGAILQVRVDPKDETTFGTFRWTGCERKDGTIYPFRKAKVSEENPGAKIYLHREILGLKRGDEAVVDHINRDTLDCRKENLRSTTHQVNNRNRAKLLTFKDTPCSSEYKGVSWHASIGKYESRICDNRKKHFLGYYTDPRDAALAYDIVARELWEEVDVPNFPYSKLSQHDLTRILNAPAVKRTLKRIAAASKEAREAQEIEEHKPPSGAMGYESTLAVSSVDKAGPDERDATGCDSGATPARDDSGSQVSRPSPLPARRLPRRVKRESRRGEHSSTPTSAAYGSRSGEEAAHGGPHGRRRTASR